MNDEAPYEVGYGKPPKAAQFKRGQSGNPKGRPPKTSENVLDIQLLLEGLIPVSRSGVKTKMSAYEVMLRSLAKKTVQEGNLSAAVNFLEICWRFGLIPAVKPESQSSVIVVPNDMRWKEWVDNYLRDGPPPWRYGNHSGLPGGNRKPKKGTQ